MAEDLKPSKILSGQTDHNTREVTDVRYGTRSLLIAMAVVAATLTALGAFLRSFPADVRSRLAVFWLILFALLGACVAYNARRRYLAEKQAGTVRFRLVPHSYFLPRVPAFARVLLGTFLLLVAPVMWAGTSFLVAENVNAMWTLLFNWQTYVALWASASGMNYLWWHQKVRVCEQGLVVRHKFVSWGSCRRWYWDACYRDVIVFEFNRNERVAAKVPAEERAVVEGLLAEKRCGSPDV